MSETIAVANMQSEDELAGEYGAITKTAQHSIDGARSGCGGDMKPAGAADETFEGTPVSFYARYTDAPGFRVPGVGHHSLEDASEVVTRLAAAFVASS